MSGHLSGLILKDAFISYGRKESKEFAALLQKRLKKANKYAWFDANDIPAAVDWQQRIYKGIDEAHNFLFVISPHAVLSRYCFKEIKHAVKRNKRIIPILHIKPTDEELAETHPIIKDINWITFVEGQDDFEMSLEALLAAMNKEADYVQLHTELLLKALNWDKQEHPTSLLLHSRERENAEHWLKMTFEPEDGVCNASDLHCGYICESKKNSENLMSDVLIYSTTSSGIRDQLRRSLHRVGITTWKFTDSAADTDPREAIRRGIQATDNVLFFISEAEMKSEFFEFELELALQYNKRIIPLYVQETPMQQVPYSLRGLRSYDLSDFGSQGFQAKLMQLVKHLQENADYHHLHKKLLVQALKWNEQSKNKSILLRGPMLQDALDWMLLAAKNENYAATTLHAEFIEASKALGVDITNDVFICYSRVDGDFVRKLNNELQVLGRATWFDLESIPPGGNFVEEIERGIENSDSVIFVISPDAAESENCKHELAYAHSLNKRFINVLFRPLDEQALPLEVEKIQWIDFTKYYKDFHKPISELLRSLDNQREHVREQTIWQKAAQKWDENGRTPARLLKGDDYRDALSWLEYTEKQADLPQPTALTKEFILKSKLAIEYEINREQRRKRMLVSALVFVTLFSLASAVLAIVAFSQASKIRAQKGQLEIQRAELKTKAMALEDALFSIQQAQNQALQANAALIRLQQERDSAMHTAKSASERRAIENKYSEIYTEQKERADRATGQIQIRSNEAKANLQQIQDMKEPENQEVVILENPALKYNDGLAKIYRDGKWGYMNRKGDIEIPCQYIRASDFNNGVAEVYTADRKYGYIDVSGKVISDWFDRIEPFKNGLAEVELNNKHALINMRGELITIWFEEIYPFHEDRAKVRQGEKWGYIDSKGNVVIPFRFDAAFQFRKGIAKVRIGANEFKINTEGRTVR